MPSHKQNSSTDPVDELKEMINQDVSDRMQAPLLTIIVYSLIQLIRFGASNNHYVFMIVGGIVSVVCIKMYTRIHTKKYSQHKKEELLSKSSMTVAYVIVFIFACYILLYQGFWGLTDLRYGFSIWVIVKSIAAIYLGREIAKSTAGISEEVKNARQPHDSR